MTRGGCHRQDWTEEGSRESRLLSRWTAEIFETVEHASSFCLFKVKLTLIFVIHFLQLFMHIERNESYFGERLAHEY